MEKTFASARLAGDTRARSLISYLDDNLRADLQIETSTVYYDFPAFPRHTNERLRPSRDTSCIAHPRCRAIPRQRHQMTP